MPETVLVLKTPKTGKQCPQSVDAQKRSPACAREWKNRRDKQKEISGDEYRDYGRWWRWRMADRVKNRLSIMRFIS